MPAAANPRGSGAAPGAGAGRLPGSMGKVTLSGKGRRWVVGGHPWVYADDLVAVEAQGGELVPVHDPAGGVVGWGLYSSRSRIAMRLVSRTAEQPTREFWAALVSAAVAERARLGLLDPKGACRLIGGDSERLPGFVVDRYADVLVVQSGCQGSDLMRDFLVGLVREALPFKVRAVLDRSDSSVRKLEGLEPRVEWIEGSVDDLVRVQEPDGLVYDVDLAQGHKTGHYLDQSANRRRAAQGAGGERVLDAFCYDGLFGIRAALAGADDVLCIDQSATAGPRVLHNAELNGVSGKVRFERANAMKHLRELAAGDTRWQRVVIDPPAFARNRKEIEGAARGYRELNLRALELLTPGGLLVSASCSYNVRREEFLGFLALAARDAGRDVYLEDLAGASPDHPVLLGLPESEYLKCAFLRAR